ncbi:Retrovirus-related Pol polyprotein from transposon 297 [Araneus ventricosus]|uniref:RNA-directed DNA polymerase n=1 Tax=Araneus ventricosus TaxID=182803 RepID=A0A4Y2GVD5_ARAVE|nr:Retrovirus-related Pol polyprotein from transposon 297 [Araneus ventricosus]
MAPNISLKTTTCEETEIRGKQDASIECGSRKFHYRIYEGDITDSCVLGLDFLQNFNFTLDLENNEILTEEEEIPLFSVSVQRSKSCCVLAKKNNYNTGKIRMPNPGCPRSSWTVQDSYPLPRIDDTLDALNGSQWFTTLDLKGGCWQVEIRHEDREKTAFTTGQGLWQFKVMPFGLCNAPATVERQMETVLRGLSSEACSVYLNGIIIVGPTFGEHLNNLPKVFQRLQNPNLKLNPKKCRFFQKAVAYLGHVISAEGVKTDPENIKAIVYLSHPDKIHVLRSFLGLCTYYRRFVKNFSTIARPLHKLTEAKSNFNWTDECETSFNSLKQALSSAPILTYPRIDKDFILDTDASNEGIGAVLSQNIGNEERVIAYFSKSLDHFHHYLYGRKFLLRTKHTSLRWLLNFREPEGHIARWIQRLQEYDFEIQHRKGTSQGNADALSKRPCKESCKHCTNAEKKFGMETDISMNVLTTEDPLSSSEVQKAQLEYPAIRPILEKKPNSEDRPSWQEIAPESPATK